MKTDDQGVSPVMGIVLLIGVVMVFTGTIAAFTLGIERPETPSNTRLSFEGVGNGDNWFYIYHMGGDSIDDSLNNLEFKTRNTNLTAKAILTITGQDNDFDVGERIEVVVENLSKSGRIKVVHRPSQMILGKSKEALQATPSGSAGGPDVTAEGADIGAYQPPDLTDCDLLVDDDWPSDEDSDGDNKFSTITDAVENASLNDLIGVKEGTYNENHITVNKSVTIASLNGPEETTIDAGGEQYVFWITSDSVDIGGFKMINYTRHGVDFQDGSNSKVSGNIFKPGTSALSAIQAFSDVSNVEVFNNITKGVGVRGYTSSVSDWTVDKNTIDVQNEAHMGIVGGGPNWTISHNEIKNCGDPSDGDNHQAIDTYQFGNASDWIIENNNIHDSEDGIEIEGTGHVANYNNIYNIANLAAGCDEYMDATHNWWGTTEESAIEAIVSSNVIFDPWLNEPR